MLTYFGLLTPYAENGNPKGHYETEQPQQDKQLQLD